MNDSRMLGILVPAFDLDVLRPRAAEADEAVVLKLSAICEKPVAWGFIGT